MKFTPAPSMERVSVCPECAALVPDAKKASHESWHARTKKDQP